MNNTNKKAPRSGIHFSTVDAIPGSLSSKVRDAAFENMHMIHHGYIIELDLILFQRIVAPNIIFLDTEKDTYLKKCLELQNLHEVKERKILFMRGLIEALLEEADPRAHRTLFIIYSRIYKNESKELMSMEAEALTLVESTRAKLTENGIDVAVISSEEGFLYREKIIAAIMKKASEWQKEIEKS